MKPLTLILSSAILRSQRAALKLSQAELARRASVARENICHFELGGRALSSDEQRRILEALRREAERLRDIVDTFQSATAVATGEVPAGA